THLASVVGSRRESMSLSNERRAAAIKSASASVAEVVLDLMEDVRPIASVCLAAHFAVEPTLGPETHKILAVCAQRRRPRKYGSASSMSSGASSSSATLARDLDMMRYVHTTAGALQLSPDQVARLRPLIAEARAVSSALLAM